MSEAPEQQGAVRNVLKKILTTLESISCVVIFFMMVLTFIDVIGRYVFHNPIFGGTEIISALLALTIFSGLGVINARDENCSASALATTAPKRKPRDKTSSNLLVARFDAMSAINSWNDLSNCIEPAVKMASRSIKRSCTRCAGY